MRSLALLLHFYQPPTQSAAITEQVLQSCYLPLADLLLAHPEAQFTLNIGIIPNSAFVEKIKILLGRGQVELSNSPIYHPLLPLVPADQIQTLLDLNSELLFKTFQKRPVNLIFPPELAVKPEIHNNNYLLDESSINPKFDLNKIPKLPSGVSSRAITEILRSYPEILTAKKFLDFIEKRTVENQVITSACDAEIFGHHYTERINLLKELFGSKRIKFIKIKDSGRGQNDVIASTWQTTDPKTPYPLWLTNDLQKKYDELANLTYHLYKKSPESNPPALNHYFKGLSSCHYYWLSNWPWWHPDLVESGARELIKCVRSLYIDPDQKLPAEKLFHEFLMAMWNYHWSGEVEKKYRDYAQERSKLFKSFSYFK